MKLILLTISLTFPFYAISANEQFTEIDRKNTPGRLYIDFNSIERDNEIVKFWYVLDVYSAHRKKGTRLYGYNELKPIEYYRSNKIHTSIDCAANKYKTHKIMQYDNAAGQGPLVGSTKPYKHERGWYKIIRGDTFSILYQHVC